MTTFSETKIHGTEHMKGGKKAKLYDMSVQLHDKIPKNMINEHEVYQPANKILQCDGTAMNFNSWGEQNQHKIH
jgi:hypothetical protein